MNKHTILDDLIKQKIAIEDQLHNVKEQIREELARIHRDHLEQSELTPREKEILFLLQKGLVGKEIGSKLNIALSTVRFHCSNLYKKIGVQRADEFRSTRMP